MSQVATAEGHCPDNNPIHLSPRKFADEELKWLRLALLDDVHARRSLSATAMIIHALAYNRHCSANGSPVVLTYAEWVELLQEAELRVLGLESWCRQTRNRIENALTRVGLLRRIKANKANGETRAEDQFVIYTTKRFFRLPLAILAHPRLTLADKVIWPAMVFNWKQSRDGESVAWASTIAGSLGYHKDTIWASIGRMTHLGLLKEPVGRRLAHTRRIVPLPDVCENNDRLILGRLPDLVDQWDRRERQRREHWAERVWNDDVKCLGGWVHHSEREHLEQSGAEAIRAPVTALRRDVSEQERQLGYLREQRETQEAEIEKRAHLVGDWLTDQDIYEEVLRLERLSEYDWEIEKVREEGGVRRRRAAPGTSTGAVSASRPSTRRLRRSLSC